MAIVDNGIFIRNAVLKHDVSDKTIRKIKDWCQIRIQCQ